MKRLAAVVIIIAGIAGWWLFHRGSAERIDLIAQFGMARKDGAPLFAVVAATLAGDTKMAISAPPNGRIHFRIRVPDDGRLNMSIGMQPAS